MFSVETNSFLPNEQSDGRDLARQGQARHRWFHAAGNASLVEILERPSCGSRSGGSSLKDIFEIMIVIFVQSADGHSFLGAFQLTANEAIFPTIVGSQRQSAVSPQLPLGTEAMGGLHQSDQQSGPDPADRGNLPQQSHGRMFPGFR